MGAFVDRLVTGSTLEADASQAAAIKALSLVQTLACVRPNAETPNLQERGSQPSISGAYILAVFYQYVSPSLLLVWQWWETRPDEDVRAVNKRSF